LTLKKYFVIKLENISKHYETRHGEKTVLRDINLQINRGEKVGIVGRNGAGKSTLVRILGGISLPDAGRVHRHMSVSWPIGFDSGVQGSMTGLDNVKFISAIYGVDVDESLALVLDFSNLGSYINEPVNTYSSGMKARLGFALSLAIDFDCMLIDEGFAVGDQRFKDRGHEELLVKRKERAMVLISHEPGMIREICETIYVLLDGQLHHFTNPEDAYLFYTETLK
jgi:capsular polysaccharide transport system ATP-binding protein